ncbi:MAG: class I SAM-dependent methyltransferase [Paludibacteraceae bacterium]|nr:class I SAM-dependent methyltransferase [Paludibacteraceae bacterium]
MHYALCIVHFLLSLHPLVARIIRIANNFQFSTLLSLLFDIKVRLQYALRAHYRKGHWVHSPFTFHTLNYVIFERTPYYSFPVIENLRQQLQQNNTPLNLQPLGTSKAKTTTIARELKNSAKSPRLAQLLQRLCASNQSHYIIELGTNLGLSTAYLASNNSNSQVFTLEGQPELCQITRQNFKQLHLNNIQIIEGNIDDTLPRLIQQIPQIDLLFIDANHQYQATINYYNLAKSKVHKNTIIIFDDIHWSKGMQQAWNEIRQDPDIRLAIDIFHMGIVWFNTDIPKQHYIVAF